MDRQPEDGDQKGYNDGTADAVKAPDHPHHQTQKDDRPDGKLKLLTLETVAESIKAVVPCDRLHVGQEDSAQLFRRQGAAHSASRIANHHHQIFNLTG